MIKPADADTIYRILLSFGSTKVQSLGVKCFNNREWGNGVQINGLVN